MTVDVDLCNFGPARREPESLAGAVGVVHAGPLGRTPGAELARALMVARERAPALRLTIAAEGPAPQPSAPTALALASSAPSGTSDARARLLASADVVLVTGAGEAAERAVLEGQASGTPVIVTAGSRATALVRPRRTGLVCDPDAGALAAALVELADAPALRSRLAAEALEAARAHHAAVAPVGPPAAGSTGAGLPAAA